MNKPNFTAATGKKAPFNKMLATDPVCKMQVNPLTAAGKFSYKNTVYYFCNVKCKEKFSADPERYLRADSPAEKCCCCAEAFEDDSLKIAQKVRKLRNGFIIAALATIFIAVINHLPGAAMMLKRYLQFALSSVAVFGAGGFLLLRGVRSLKGFKLNMFTLISMGISSAYFYSVYALFFANTLPPSLLDSNGVARLHFTPAAMITALVILGQYLEARASSGASRAVRSLMELVPPVARKISCCGKVSEIPLDQVNVGDTLQILPHDKIPVDGVVVEGIGAVDESMLTGESLPVEKHIGSQLAAGTVNGETLLIMKTSAIGKATLLSQIVDLVKNARNTRLPIQRLADKVSAVFVPAVLAIALASLLYWGVGCHDWSMALGNFMAVLLAACPCSLGLAAPLAVMVGTGVGARHGILIKNPAILEDLRKVDTIMLDKTGTLTENKPHVEKVYLTEDVSDDEFYPILLAMEQHSQHPLANAIIKMDQATQYCNDLPAVSDLVSIPGQGISAVVKAQKYFVGSMTFMQNNNIECSEFLRQYQVNMDHSMVFMGCNKKIMGCVCIGDKLRDDAALVVAGLKKRSIHPIILSGDNKSTVRACAYKLGIEEFYSELTPQEKMQKVQAQQAFGRYVAMLGDGVNDAGALAAANVSVAMGTGTDAAWANSSVTLLAGNIGKLAGLLRLSEAVNDTIKLNLLLAFAYNIILIPLAAGLFYSFIHWQFSPIASSIAMSGSCLLVVSNSLRLWKFKL